MRELTRTNDIVAISLIEVLLRDRSIEFMVLDQHMSVLEGTIGILPRRILVDEERIIEARRLLRDAGLAEHLPSEDAKG